MTDVAHNQDRPSRLEFANTFLVEALRMIRKCAEGDGYPLETCLHDIVGLIQKHLDLYTVTLLMEEDGTEEIVLLAYSGRDPSLQPHVKKFRIRRGQGLCGACAQTGKTIVVPEVSRDPRFIRGPLEQTRSELCIPITVAGRVVAVLDLQDSRPDSFDPETVRVFEELSGSIGLILETRRLHDDLMEYSETLQHRVEEQMHQLRDSEDRFRRLVEHASDPILLVDRRGVISYANRAAGALLGYDPPELGGTLVTRYTKKGTVHKLASVYREVLEGHRPRPARLEMVTKEGQPRTVEVTAIPLEEGGKIENMEIILRDVTEKVTVERLKKNYMKTLEEEVQRRTQEIKETQRASILAIANLAESIDEDTGGHLDRIRHYCRTIALELRKTPKYADLITDEYVELLFDLSPLHDLGKVGIRDYILLKNGKLTDEEFKIMQQHTEIGARALREAGRMIHRESMFAVAEMIARFHHERWDGSGYPAVEVNGENRPLRGEEIPLCARIVALADVYDALSSKRPYKEPLPHEWVKQKIVSESGKHFDPDLVQALLNCEKEVLEIRARYPDSMPVLGRPFRLPDRDKEELARIGFGPAAPPPGEPEAKPETPAQG